VRLPQPALFASALVSCSACCKSERLSSIICIPSSATAAQESAALPLGSRGSHDRARSESTSARVAHGGAPCSRRRDRASTRARLPGSSAAFPLSRRAGIPRRLESPLAKSSARRRRCLKRDADIFLFKIVRTDVELAPAKGAKEARKGRPLGSWPSAYRLRPSWANTNAAEQTRLRTPAYPFRAARPPLLVLPARGVLLRGDLFSEATLALLQPVPCLHAGVIIKVQGILIKHLMAGG
jgi:hypothetical protein